ncbi:MAG: isocitrate lyase [Chloroflexi bacterium]|nr:isocitrate lyase [Chloroflexota bacterium]
MQNRAARIQEQIAELERSWTADVRWKGIKRAYSAGEVVSLRSSLRVEQTIAKAGSRRLWDLLHTEPYIATFGALTGGQAVQMVKGGLKAIYLSGWQVAADANQGGNTYPDQSLYPVNSVPALVKRINNAFMRADQIEGDGDIHWYAPIVADAEAGFGGPIHAFELMRNMIEAGAAGVHFEDQLAAEKKCGHMGGKVLVPTSQFIRTLTAARLAADVLDVPTLLVARTDARDATLLTSDVDPYDRPFVTGERTVEGYHMVKKGMASPTARALAYAPYADLIWFETSVPELAEAKKFAETIHAKFPGKLLAYNLSPSFNWRRHLDAPTIAKFQSELGAMGFKFQFITLAGWHLLNYHTFDMACGFATEGMPAYVRLQQAEFARESDGYTAVRHQRESGAEYFDKVAMAASGGQSSTTALHGSTEEEQFETAKAR